MSFGILIAVLAATIFGTAQFLNAAVAATVPGLLVARWTMVGGALVTGTVTVLARPGLQSGTVLWALLAGAGGALGAAALYRSLERGNISVVIPLCTTTTTAIPVIIGLVVLGESTDASTVGGILVALLAIVLVSRSRAEHAIRGPAAGALPGDRGPRASASWTIGLPLLAGAGFAMELVGISRFPAEQLAPSLWLSFLISTALLLLIPVPDRVPTRRREVMIVLLAGALTAAAMMAFHRATELAGLAIAGVVVGLYPAVPVCLAVVLLGERPGRVRLVGLALAAVAVLVIGGR